MAVGVTFLMYFLYLIPSGIRVVTGGTDILVSNLYPNVLFVLEALFTIFFQKRIFGALGLLTKLKRLNKVESSGGINQALRVVKVLYVVNITYVIAIGISYLLNDFSLKYIIRDSVRYTFLFTILNTFLLEIHTNDRAYNRIIKAVGGIFLIHAGGLGLFAVLFYGLSPFLRRALLVPFQKGSGLMLSFFGGAPNEECYSMLISFWLFSIVMTRTVKLLGFCLVGLLVLYNGSRAPGFLYFATVGVYVVFLFKSNVNRMLIAIFGLICIMSISGYLLKYFIYAFPDIKDYSDVFSTYPFFADVNIGSRIFAMWMPLLKYILSDFRYVFGLSIRGISEFTSKIFYINWILIGHSVHNTFLFFLASTGLVSFGTYLFGFVYMIRRVKKEMMDKNSSIADFSLPYFFAVLTMFVFASLSNANSFNGVLLYIFIICIGYGHGFLSHRSISTLRFGRLT